jgi:nitrate/TMAO reductase-like tetraheme cytochrome c subunit
VVGDPVYQNSTHRTSGKSVIAGCADCHLSLQGLLAKTWAHVKGGVKNVWIEMAHDLEKPEVWEQLRTQLAYNVRDALLVDDRANCRACHEIRKIAVEGEKDQRAHARFLADETTCIQCHINLVHTPVTPRDGFAAATSV